MALHSWPSSWRLYESQDSEHGAKQDWPFTSQLLKPVINYTQWHQCMLSMIHKCFYAYGYNHFLRQSTKHYTQLWVKDLPKVPTWWLERDSNLWPAGHRALSYKPHIM